MKPLRILHVTPYYEEAWAYGGIPRIAGLLARHLAQRGHHVVVCTTDACEARRRLAPARQAAGAAGAGNDPATEPRVLCFANLSNHLAYHLQLFVPLGLGRFLRETGSSFDVAHLHGTHHLPGALAAHHLAAHGVPYVLAPNGTAPLIERRRLAKWLFDRIAGRHVLPGAARIIAVTVAERRQLARLGVPRERIRVLPNPVDPDETQGLRAGRFRQRLGLPPDVPLVLYLGRLSPRKGLDVLVRAAAGLRGRPMDPFLVIAGNDMGLGEARLRRFVARAAGPGSRIRRVGLLRKMERLEALADADVVVYPGQHEIFGLVPLEALLCGTPAVVADDSGAAEIIRSLGGGLVAAQGDALALRRAIQQVLDHRETWRQAAVAARPEVVRFCGAESVVARLEVLYRELAGS